MENFFAIKMDLRFVLQIANLCRSAPVMLLASVIACTSGGKLQIDSPYFAALQYLRLDDFVQLSGKAPQALKSPNEFVALSRILRFLTERSNFVAAIL